MSSQKNALVPFAISAIAGFAVCLAITVATEKKEAWDSSLYFAVGIPIMCLFAFALGYVFPAKAWRWAFGMAIGQSIAMVIGGGSLSLWPLSIIAMTILSLPQLVAALVASGIANGKESAPPEPH